MENKSDRNDNIIILRHFNCTINKMEKDGGNKIQRLHGCGSIYFLSKLIVDKRLEDLYRRKNLDSLDFTNYDRSSGTRCKIGRVCTHKTTANNTKINQMMLSFTDHYNAISLDRLPWKTKSERYQWYFNESLLCKHRFSPTTKNFFFIKNPIFQQVTIGNTQILVLKRMLEHFLKIPPLKRTIKNY